MTGAEHVWWVLLSVQINTIPPNQSWIVVVISIAIATFTLGMHIARHWGHGPKSRLKLEIANSQAPNQDEADGLYSHGWIENPLVPVRTDEESMPMEERSLIRAHFARAKITNSGNFTAKSITFSLTSIQRITYGGETEPIVTTVQPLRWSDTWRFEADQRRNLVSADPGIITFPKMPQDDHRYCDICFHYDLQGPKSIGRFRRGLVYFAIKNLPSQTYALEPGLYEVTFNLVAENCVSLQRKCKLIISLEMPEPRQRVRFEFISEIKGRLREELPVRTKSAAAGQ